MRGYLVRRYLLFVALVIVAFLFQNPVAFIIGMIGVLAYGSYIMGTNEETVRVVARRILE